MRIFGKGGRRAKCVNRSTRFPDRSSERQVVFCKWRGSLPVVVVARHFTSSSRKSGEGMSGEEVGMVEGC